MRNSSGDDGGRESDGRESDGRDNDGRNRNGAAIHGSSSGQRFWLGSALFGAALFAWLAREVTIAGPITEFDARYHAARHALSTPAGVRFFVAFTTLGSPVFMTTVALLGACWLVVARRRELLLGWIGAFAGAALIVQIAKRTIQHPRPIGAEEYLHGASFSFPSGHVVGALVGFGMLAYVLTRVLLLRRTATLGVYLLTASMIVTIAWSRIYLGVHFVSDILGGIAIGGAWLIVAIMGTEWICKHHADHRDRVSRM